MTDNEIEKALERWAGYNCDRCIDKGEACMGEECEKIVALKALDLINRQKAEIERLKEFEFMYKELCE